MALQRLYVIRSRAVDECGGRLDEVLEGAPASEPPGACDASADVERLTSCLRLIEGAVSAALGRVAGVEVQR